MKTVIFILMTIVMGAIGEIDPSSKTQEYPFKKNQNDHAKLNIDKPAIASLDLSADQKKEVKALQSDFSSKMKSINQSYRMARDQLNEMIESGSSDQALDSQISKITSLKAQELRFVIQNRRKMESILGREKNNQFMSLARKKYFEKHQRLSKMWPPVPILPPHPESSQPTKSP